MSVLPTFCQAHAGKPGDEAHALVLKALAAASKPVDTTCFVATSGKVTQRHRLNRRGNRQANHALWRVVFTRMASEPRTRIYVQRRLDEGLSKPEIIRILKRYVARETYRHLPRT